MPVEYFTFLVDILVFALNSFFYLIDNMYAVLSYSLLSYFWIMCDSGSDNDGCGGENDGV